MSIIAAGNERTHAVNHYRRVAVIQSEIFLLHKKVHVKYSNNRVYVPSLAVFHCISSLSMHDLLAAVGLTVASLYLFLLKPHAFHMWHISDASYQYRPH